MDASNYYAQASDLQPIDQLFLERRDNRRVALSAGPTSGLAVEQEPASHAPGEERVEHKAQKTTVRFRELTSERPKAPARVAQETDPGQQDRRGKYWTRAEDETLISMFQAGASHSAPRSPLPTASPLSRPGSARRPASGARRRSAIRNDFRAEVIPLAETLAGLEALGVVLPTDQAPSLTALPHARPGNVERCTGWLQPHSAWPRP